MSLMQAFSACIPSTETIFSPLDENMLAPSQCSRELFFFNVFKCNACNMRYVYKLTKSRKPLPKLEKTLSTERESRGLGYK